MKGIVALALMGATFELGLAVVGAGPASAAITFVTKWGSSGSGDGQFDIPWGVAVDSSGYVYVADFSNHRIQKFASSDGAFVAKWGAPTGSGDGQLNFPIGVATDSTGNVYVADAGNVRIQKFSSSGTFLTKWGSSGSGDGQFDNLGGLATDSSGNVYVADTYNHRIQKFSSSGSFITKWGGNGSGDGQFSFPNDVATDSAGNVYVADTSSNRIQKFSSAGAFLTKWGSSGSADGQLDQPIGVGTDSAGNVYVADTGNNRIQKFSSSGTFLAKWGSSGTGDGQFNLPYDVTIDSGGGVYVSEANNDRVQKFQLAPPGAPTVSSASPASPANNNSPKILGAAVAGSTVKLYTASDCSGSPAATGTAADFASPGLTVPVADDSTTIFKATATDSEGTSSCSSGSVTYVEDSTRPTASIDTYPSDPTNSTSASFTFSADETTTFECKLDSESFAGCSNSKSYSGLAEGSHTFQVRATDAVGNAGTAAFVWTVDLTLPIASIGSHPSDPTSSTAAGFAFSANEPATFECKLDAGPFTSCTSPAGYSGLALGPHTFQVRPTDLAGNTGAAARFSWTVEAPKCIVPRLKGKKLRAAKAAIAKARCKTGKITRAYSEKVRRGRVISQKPRPGKRLAAGARVALVVSRGPRR